MCLWQGVDVNDGKLDLISNIIRNTLKIECAVLMGANVAPDVAQEQFCETTIGMHPYTTYLLTALAREVMQLPLSICLFVCLYVYPSICFHSVFGTDWLLTLNFCVWVGHDCSSRDWRSRSVIRPMQSVRPRLRTVFLVQHAVMKPTYFPVPSFHRGSDYRLLACVVCPWSVFNLCRVKFVLFSNNLKDWSSTHIYSFATGTADTWHNVVIELTQEIGRHITTVTEDARETVPASLHSFMERGNDDDDDDMTILVCAQKPTDASLIYRTVPKTKTSKMKKPKNKRICSEETVPGKKLWS